MHSAILYMVDIVTLVVIAQIDNEKLVTIQPLLDAHDINCHEHFHQRQSYEL